MRERDSKRRQPTVTKSSVLFVAAIAAMHFGVLQSAAQTTYLPTGTVQVLKSSGADCTNRGFNNPSLCQLAIVNGCRNIEDLKFLFAINPAKVTPIKGTIVLLSGFGGTNATEAPDQGNSFVNSYTSAGYTVLQVAWG